ncbi:Sapep family Mn(2+)-dependent dipeptidase [Enterococcus sp. AZ072]|uniref:Sapep family Mn(2+)-dependent dipeptidase n=1 Tax=unclassified Enterococcus TaxID=2608891 RepID=UPI003D2C8AEC
MTLLQETIDLLKQFVSYQSYPTSETTDQEDVVNFTLKHCSEFGFIVKKISSTLGWVQIGNEGPLVAFPIHLDVVPPGNGWTTDPFTLVEQDQILFGRGVYDNKGPAAVMIVLLNELRQKIEETGVRVRLIIGAQEETGMACIQQYTLLEEKPVAGFVPDAMFPIVLGEKGRMHLLLESKESIPWLDEVVTGEQVNSVPDRAILKVKAKQDLDKINLNAVSGCEDRTVYCQGISAHAAKPELGKNAFFQLMKAIDPLARSKKMNNLLQLSEVNGTNIELSCPESRFGNTTVNAGIINFKENNWRVEVDIRFNNKLTQEMILHKLQQFFPDWTMKVLTSKDVHLVKDRHLADQLIGLYRSYDPTDQTEPIYMGGSTYASYFDNFAAFGPRFPDTRTYAHGKNERMKISDLEKLIQIYKDAIQIVIEEARKNEL